MAQNIKFFCGPKLKKEQSAKVNAVKIGGD